MIIGWLKFLYYIDCIHCVDLLNFNHMKKHYTYLFLAVTLFLSGTITIKAQVNVNDSLALVDLYNSTNGPNWYNHKNWLTGPVKKWYGIYLSNDGKRVKSIYLSENTLIGSIPSSLGNLIYLESLTLYDNQLNGNIPSELGNLSNLGTLNLSNNQLSGDIPPELGNLSNLSYLYLSKNQLSGNIPSEFANLSNIVDLFLSKNQLSGNIPPELGKLSGLRWMDLSSNKLNGAIPPELGNPSALEFLYLNNNQLNGSIPSELGNLLYLSDLFLSYNELSGSIPPELGNLSIGPFSSLDLSNNRLSGNIPPELGNLLFSSDGYGSLNLSNNQLSGHIPPELGKLKYLYYLYLDHNKLSGSIPASIANLAPYLDSLNFSHNRFTFDGMESIAKKFPFAMYDWQMPIPLHVNGNTLSVSAGGTLSNNTYVWYKRDKPGNITIAGDSVFHPTESGTYFVKVRNKVAKDLKLVSRAVKYIESPSFNAVASNNLPEVLNKSFSVYPNPAKDIIHINKGGNISVSLLSQSGKVLLTETIGKTGSINVTGIAAGVYYLRNNNTNDSKKILITK
jgi:Leucine-rich repeat (LRR) protein